MADHSVGKTKSGAGCDWVRARLPLWVGDRAGRTGENEEGGELSALEHRRIERHVEQCDTCARHRFDLEGALGALVAAAAEVPVQADAPSLWPELNRRIQDFRPPAPSRAGRIALALTGPWLRGLTDFRTDQPLRRVWVADELRAIFKIKETERLGSKLMLGSVLRLGMVASILIGVVAIRSAWREWANAQETITTNVLPLANRAASWKEPVVEPQPEPGRSDERDTQNELAQSDVIRPLDTPGGGGNSLTEPKPAAPARFGYDLEHGIPMPPDARESKPVY